MLLRLDGAARTIGARTLFREVSLEVRAGDRIGLVGANGAGKTTLLRIAAGAEPPDAGAVHRARHVRVGLLAQEVDPRSDRSVREEAASALAHLDALEQEIAGLEREIAALGRRGIDPPPELAERYDRQRAAFEGQGGFERAARVERVLAGLGFDGEALDRGLHSFSGGWLVRVELAKLLLAAPDVLLLDEPTNHLDLPSIQWFEETLAGYQGGVVVVSHDRTFLRRHATRVAELERERLTVYEGGFDGFGRWKSEQRALLEAQQRNQERRVAETERFIERFRYKASKARQVQSRIKTLERMERVEIPDARAAAPRLRIPAPPRSGETVLALEGVHKRYGERVVYAGIDLELRRGERVALAGPNGAGKSTLLRIAAGRLEIEAGDRRLGHNVTPAFYAQHQLEELEGARTVLEELESAATLDDQPRLRGHLGAFLFSGDDVSKKVSVLSGGEKARLALAKLLLRPANFLILDEPTNHLDVAAREVLEAALAAYAGTILFISHDRAFINALATRVLEVRAGALHSFPGDYDDYLRARPRGGEALAEGEAAAPPPAAAPPESKQERMAARAAAKEQARRLARATRRLATVEEEILRHEERLEELAHQLTEPEVYRDGDLVRAIEADRASVREAIGALYAEWETVAAQVEALGGQIGGD